MKRVFLFVGFFSAILFSCKTVPEIFKNPYPDMTTLQYRNSNAYEFKNNQSNKLFIYIDGSGLTSVLGVKQNETWKNLRLAYFIARELRNEYTVFIPEKFNMEAGSDYSNNREKLANYTMENLLNCYLESINMYLSESDYQNIVIFGVSEGAHMLPYIYNNMAAKDQVDCMVSTACGGLSQYEQFKILANSSVNMPDSTRALFQDVDNEMKKINADPYSLDKTYYGWPYNFWSSFINVRPFEEYKVIDIPIYFIHGELDINTAVESTKYIEEHLPEKPFEYLYYENMGHGPKDEKEIVVVINDIKKWIEKTNSAAR
jgi:esterase/lipase